MKIRLVAIHVLIVLLVLATFVGVAQRPFRFTRYDIDDGLGNMTCEVLGQDSTGFLWIGARPLTRFDGYRFKTYSTEPGNIPAVAHLMADDGKGHLLFAGSSVLSWYNSASGNVEPILENGKQIYSGILLHGQGSVFWGAMDGQLIGIKMPVQTIERFTIPASHTKQMMRAIYSHSGKLWFTGSNTLWSFDTQSHVFGNVISLPEKVDEHVRFHIADDGRLFLILRNEILLVDEVNDRISTSINLTQRLGNSNFRNYTARCSRNGEYVWVCGTAGSIFRIETATDEVKEYIFSDLNVSSLATVSDFVLHELWDGKICIGALNQGLFVLDPTTGSVDHYAPDDNNEGALPTSGSNYAITQTSDDVLWITGVRAGLLKVEISKGAMSSYTRISEGGIHEYEPNVRCIEELDSSTLFYSTFNEVSRFDRYTHTFSPLPSPEGGTPFKLIKAVRFMIKDKHDNLFLLGWSGELAYLDYKNKRTLNFADVRLNALNPPLCKTLLLDSRENLWIGSSNGMVVLNTKNLSEPDFNWSKLDFEEKEVTNGFMIFSTSTGLAEDDKGNIWIGRVDGLYVFNCTSNTYLRKEMDPENPNLGVISILKSGNNTLWIGTDGGGLKMWDEAKDAFISYSISEGLPDNVIYSIEEDAHGNLWLGTNKGICCFNTVTKLCRRFTEKDGIQNYEFNGNSSGETWDGLLAFGGVAGFNLFHPDSVNHTSMPPRIVFTEFNVHGKSHPFDQGEIRLAYNENDFSFEFAALDFFYNRENQYAYKMDGIDKDWVMCGDRRFVNYPELDPGTYTFHVKACNSDGVWNETGISKTIVIASPWWATWWFRIAALVLIATGLYALYRYRLTQRTKLLLVRNSIASDLHDEIGSTLSSISLSSAIIQKKITDANPEVQQLLAQIGNNTDNMMEAMSDIVWTINAKNDRFENVINRMRAFAIEILEPKDCVVHFVADAHAESLSLDMKQRKNLYLIFKEAVNNAAKYAQCRNVQIDLHLNGNNRLNMKIVDDGMGFDMTQGGKSNLSGNGLYNMKKRAEEMKGKLTIESAPGKGTSLELEFIV